MMRNAGVPTSNGTSASFRAVGFPRWQKKKPSIALFCSLIFCSCVRSPEFAHGSLPHGPARYGPLEPLPPPSPQTRPRRRAQLERLVSLPLLPLAPRGTQLTPPSALIASVIKCYLIKELGARNDITCAALLPFSLSTRASQLTPPKQGTSSPSRRGP